MALARTVGEELNANGLTKSGEYLLGSTAPDIRVLTRWDRQVTHFFDLASFEPQRGVEGLFHAQPQIAEATLLNDSTRAFMAGYITHLEMDECWINDVYRPFFGVHSTLAGDSRANVLDRVLQYELERKIREDRAFMSSCESALRSAAMEIECGFLEQETLERWREINLDVVSRPPDWDRFRQIASRHLKDAGIETVEAVEAFMTEIPDLLEETREHVSEERIEHFMDSARERSRQSLKEYLQ